ncbi:hypothetical protein ACTHT0_11795, partial [Neisseria sp. P0014.S006]
MENVLNVGLIPLLCVGEIRQGKRNDSFFRKKEFMSFSQTESGTRSNPEPTGRRNRSLNAHQDAG